MRAAGGEVFQPPNPVAGATAERSPVVADDAADMILAGLDNPPEGGSLAAIQVHTLSSPGNRSHGHSGRLLGGLAESEAVGSLVMHELDPRRGRSTPGFGLPAEELAIVAADDRTVELDGAALATAERVALVARPVGAIR